MKKLISILFAAATVFASAQDQKLTGTVIGSKYSVDYDTGSSSTTVNTAANAFDGDMNTFFASYDRSFTWTGLELDQSYVITRIGYCARNDASVGPQRMQLGVFQGANEADFSDALPIYLIPEPGKAMEMTYVDVACSKGFKYVRYVGPNDARCNVAEIEFYGYAGEGDEESLYQPTNLPLVVVNTPNMEWFHEWDKEYEMNGSQIYVIDGGKIDTGAPGQIRGRGNASWGFPKKPFRIKFDEKQKVLGGPAKAKKWTMINNYGDKTLMRNMLAFEISRRIGMEYTPACHPVDLIFNGEYQGTYQLCDQIEVNKNRVNITEMEATDTEGEALTGGYLIEIDAYANQEADGEWFYSGAHNIPVTIKSPEAGVQEQYDYISDYFTKLERAVYSANYGDSEYGYRKYLDEESFLRHFIVGELSGNTDTYWSVYMTLDRNETKFQTGPCWDFDLAFENDNRTYPINSKSDYICLSNGSFANGMKTFVRRIVKDPNGSKDLLTEIWSDARENLGFTPEEFDDVITEYSDMLYQSQALNFKRWDIMNVSVHQNPKIWGSYDAEVQNVRNYMSKRFDKLDSFIGRLPTKVCDQLTSESLISIQGNVINITGNEYYVVSNIQGMAIATGRGDAAINVSPGIYVVRTPSKTVKVCLKNL